MKCKSFVLVMASLVPTMAFVLTHTEHRRKTSMSLKVLACNLTTGETAAQVPPKPRDIMTVLSTRYGEGDWTKTRNYLYHAKEKLSLQQVEAVLHFLESTFDETQIRSILQCSPRILSKNPQSKLKPTTNFLQQLYGSDLFHEAVSRNPDLLLSSGLGYDSSTDNPVEPYLQNELQLIKSDVSKLQQAAPFFFQIPLAKIKHVTAYLTNLLHEGGYKPEDAVKVVAKVMIAHPHLFHLSVQTNLQPRIDFLVQTCRLSRKNVASLIKSSSGILGLSVDDNFKPTLYYLMQILNPKDNNEGRQALNKCVLSHPPILALSQKNIKQKVDFFEAIDAAGCGSVVPESGTGDDSLAARIALRSPVVYSLSLKDNIMPTVEFLAKVWGAPAPHVLWMNSELTIGQSMFQNQNYDPSLLKHQFRRRKNDAITTSTTTLGTLIRDYPGILTLSLEGNLQPTFHFYNKTGYTTLDENWNLVQAEPKIRGRYIAASLFQRLLPRWHYCMEQQQQSSSAVFLRPPLHVIAGSTDASFCKWLGYNLDDYLAFQKEFAPRLKFSSQFDTWLKTGRAIDI